MNLKQIQLPHRNLLKLIPYALWLIALISLVWVSLFMYYDVIMGIQGTEQLRELKKEVVDVKINIPLFETVTENLSKKTDTDIAVVKEIKNPFEKKETEQATE